MEVDLDAIEGGCAGLEDALAELAPLEACGAITREGGHIKVSSGARLLLRVVCAAFDHRLAGVDQTAPRHAAAV
ncbi:MAG: hypothetical protein IIC86_06685 [Chloroflexi bacterium]|nr:hypothetical protein [Chloroflexota bacterium]